MWAQGLAYMSKMYDIFFSYFEIELQALSCFFKGLVAKTLNSMPKAWLTWGEI